MEDDRIIALFFARSEQAITELSQKYGVHYTNIAKRAKKEDWQQQRQQHINTVQTKMQQAVERKQVDRAARLQSVADKLLNKIEEAVDRYAMEEIFVDRQGLRQITGALKDIKDIQMIRSEADLREQEARIAKLRKEAEREEESKDVKVEISSELEEYSL